MAQLLRVLHRIARRGHAARACVSDKHRRRARRADHLNRAGLIDLHPKFWLPFPRAHLQNKESTHHTPTIPGPLAFTEKKRLLPASFSLGWGNTAMSSSLQDPTPSRARCRPRWSWEQT
ncbi:hypothetical protein KY285_000642 [Solanum tuberosum]|nr:hypothetical protein KY285_000642 [Solanum tuberosum]